MADELIGDLARDVDVPVVSGRSSFQLDLQKLAAPEVARRLKVRFLVDGSVRRDGEQLVIRAQLIDGSDGRVVWTHDARAGVADWSAARAALVDRMAGSVRTSLWRVEKQRALAARAPASLDAYTLATRAYADKHLFNEPAYRDGRAAAQRAIQLDPNYAFAWAVLGYLNNIDSGNNITGEWPPSRRLAVLAWVQAAAGQTEAARSTLDKVLPLYPIAPVYINNFEADVRWAARDNAAALAATDRCIERAPRYAYCRLTRAIVLFELSRLDEAKREAEMYRTLQPNASRASFGTFAAAPDLDARRMKAADAFGFAPAP